MPPAWLVGRLGRWLASERAAWSRGPLTGAGWLGLVGLAVELAGSSWLAGSAGSAGSGPAWLGLAGRGWLALSGWLCDCLRLAGLAIFGRLAGQQGSQLAWEAGLAGLVVYRCGLLAGLALAGSADCLELPGGGWLAGAAWLRLWLAGWLVEPARASQPARRNAWQPASKPASWPGQLA